MTESNPENPHANPPGPVPSRRRLLAFRAVVLVAILAVGWVGGELLLALLHLEPTYVAPELHPGRLPARIALDRELLFRFVPRSRNDLNNLGYRDRDFGAKSAGRRRVLMVGDSFVMGVSTTSHETIPRRLETFLGSPWEVFNMGVYGDGPDQTLLRLKRDGLKLAPDQVILGLFPANDFGDLMKNLLLEPAPGGGVRRTGNDILSRELPRSRVAMHLRHLLTPHYMDPAREQSIFQALMGDAYLSLEMQSAPLREHLTALMREILAEFRRLADEHGFRFAVVVIPPVQAFGEDPRAVKDPVPPEQAVSNDPVVLELCAELGIDALYLLEALAAEGGAELYDPIDVHLNAAGSRVAAQAIQARFFADATSPPPTSSP
ncbi:MAG TPA: hypothetical protein PLS90_04605 [Candidatus Sumerlaeota bacterium]|nr:hypothetical protein [Candidatus Sumerlaeota bacterium]HPK01719.1 hypothetical protein [Candidatus Sumerlaeota bacterium]